MSHTVITSLKIQTHAQAEVVKLISEAQPPESDVPDRETALLSKGEHEEQRPISDVQSGNGSQGVGNA
jgi:hypothetical protein